MQKKEYYKHSLPHFQQPGQTYFVTWSLKDAIPKHKLEYFEKKLEILKLRLRPGLADSGLLGLANSDSPLVESRIGIRESHKDKSRYGNWETLEKQYFLLRKKYIQTYNDLLDIQKNPVIDLSKTAHIRIITDALTFWEAKKLKNHTFCIMPNHVHWVFELFEKDEEGNSVYLQDILYSVKRFTATKINKIENRKGALWQKESFDTTIRDERHLYYAFEYTLNNPVKAGFVKDWKDWPGCWLSE